MMGALMDDPQLDAVFGRICIRCDPGGVKWPWMRYQDDRHAPGSNLGNALYRSRILRRIDGFDERLSYGEDFDYFNRLQEIGIRFALCDVDGMVYRRHATNMTNDQRAMQDMHFEIIRRRMALTGRSPTRAHREGS